MWDDLSTLALLGAFIASTVVILAAGLLTGLADRLVDGLDHPAIGMCLRRSSEFFHRTTATSAEPLFRSIRTGDRICSVPQVQ
jgi:hypothetical protein